MKHDNLLQNPLLMEATKRAIERRQSFEREDPTLLCHRTGIVPDQWQADLLRSKAQQMILLCSRQAGKSTVSSYLAVHQAVYTQNSLILVLSPSQRQSSELFRGIKDVYNSLHDTCETESESALQLELSNGSRIVALPGKEATIRGFSGVDLLIVDEASRVPDELYQAVRPMLAVSGGRIILLSTPFGQRGFFHEEWTSKDESWHRTKITAYQCPRIPINWLEQERNRIGDYWFRQEYLCEFVDTQDQLFSSDDIRASLSDDVKPLEWW
jgi:phage terminase large subunit-like protein